jgi:hypothetical protein
MNRIQIPVFFILAILLFNAGCSTTKHPKSKVAPAVYDEMAQLDSILFQAFNTRDLPTIKTLFTADLEFFHDKGGLSDYDQNIAAIQALFEGETRVRRELVKGSLEVFPVPNYGIIQTGIHRFYNTEPGQPERLGGVFKFLHIWKKENSAWKISRVVSYDH